MTERRQARIAAQAIGQERYSYAKAIFFGGSAAEGVAATGSAIDLVVLYAEIKTAFQEAVTHDGWLIHAHIHDASTLKYLFNEIDRVEGYAPLQHIVADGIELTKPTEFSARIRKTAYHSLKLGPVPWRTSVINEARFRLTVLIDCLSDPHDDRELIAAGTELYQSLANFYCRAQGAWSAKGKAIPQQLQYINPGIARRFDFAFQRFFTKGDETAVIELADELMSPYGGFLRSGYRTEAPENWRC